MFDSQMQLQFPSLGGKKLVAAFDGGQTTSDAGVLLLASVDKELGLISSLAGAMGDNRQRGKVVHSVQTMLKERIFGICQGYPDANDFDYLGGDSAFKIACADRLQHDRALASQPTLSRFENSCTRRDIQKLFEAQGKQAVRLLPKDSRVIYIDVDSTVDPCYGHQQLALFNRHYQSRCYHPLLFFVTGANEQSCLVTAFLRKGSTGLKRGVVRILKRIVPLLRAQFPQAQLILRGDAAFGINDVLNACDKLNISYLLACPPRPNIKKTAMAKIESLRAEQTNLEDGVTIFTEFQHQAKNWSGPRRIIVAAEVKNQVIEAGHVLTNLSSKPERIKALYNKRGDIENRIKELKLDLESGRTSCCSFSANQFRLLLHSAAFNLMAGLRNLLTGTELARAQFSTLRLRLLKIGARIVETARKIWFHLPSSCPNQASWQIVHRKIFPIST